MFDFTLEPYWTLVLLLAGGVYLAVLELVRRGLLHLDQKVKRESPSERPDSSAPFVSVIIPCRNEARHIGETLEDLGKQDYPADRFEVIVVDDRSSDGSGEIAGRFHDRVSGLKVLRVESCPAGISPKKNALRRGFALARGEIIISTDADCRFPSGWISSLSSEFNPETGLATGLTIFDRGIQEPFWQRMQQLDYLSHSFFAAGAISRGWAFNCNGSNLALRRAAFEDIDGYADFKQVITGDDTLLLQRLRRRGRWRLCFSARPASLVRSWPEETPMDVLNQRLRWGSGGLSYSSPALVFALCTFVFFLSLLLSPILWLLGLASSFWMFLLILKALQEARVMAQGFQAFGLKPDWSAFLVMELIHIPAILSFSIGGHVVGFRWKGERFRRAKAAPISPGEVAEA